jgi:hypothetical protein
MRIDDDRPFLLDPEGSRPMFRLLRELRETLATASRTWTPSTFDKMTDLRLLRRRDTAQNRHRVVAAPAEGISRYTGMML